MPTDQNKSGMGNKPGMQDKKRPDNDANRATKQASDRGERGRTDQSQGKPARDSSDQGSHNR
jgi:hypothetical protein